MKFRLATLLVLCLALTTHAQDRNKIKFGKLSKSDFEPTVYQVDSNASAVVLADIGSSEFTGNTKGWFSLDYKFFRRARILNRKGYEIADVEISLYTDNEGSEEDLESLRAVTYNLEDGKIVETKLDMKESVFKTRVSKNIVVKKFTLPNIREGSIIEYEYKIKSDFLFNMQPWDFQGEYPVLWSDFKVSMPQFLNYVFLAQGYQSLAVNEKKDKVSNFSINVANGSIGGRTETFSAGVTDYRWAMKDVPALKEERFTSSLRNHLARIEFQLAEYREPITPRNIMGTWPEAMQKMLTYEEFGMELVKDRNWLGDVLSDIGVKEGDPRAAQTIYAWVRDNIANEHYTSLYLHKAMKQVYKTKSGSSTDINMFLIALLRKAGLGADPVLMSTRGHGWAYPKYPMIGRFNYVVAQTRVNNQLILLDASRPKMGFGRLDPELYNGHARVVNDIADSLTLNSDQMVEAKTTSMVVISEKDGTMSGSCEMRPGYVESTSLRDKLARSGNGGYVTELQKGMGRDAEVRDLAVELADSYDTTVVVKYKFEMKGENADLLYFNPMLSEGWKENPFKSAVRNYPVEIPYQIDETYLLRLAIPDGYEVDEVPKQLRMKLNADGDGSFEYFISANNGTVSLRSRLKLTRCYFLPDEYNSMREFFALVVKKHSEQIVFKKKKS